MKNEVKHVWSFDRAPQEVWEYLTKPELMEQWLMKSDFKPEVGHKFHFIGNCNSDGKTAALCEVLEVKPYSRLSYSWQTDSLTDKKPYTSLVVWTLVGVANRTDLHLVHNGFKAVEDVDAHNDGWTRLGNNIAALFNATVK